MATPIATANPSSPPCRADLRSAAGLPAGFPELRKSRPFTHYPCVTFYRRRLPHFYNHDHPIFLTWCLHGSLPPNRHFPGGTLTSGESFAALDRLLDEARTGPFHLNQPAIATLVVAAIHHSTDVLSHYTLHAFVVMPNHVHLLMSPHVPLPNLTKTLKTFTARQANQILTRTGSPFWQEESYDRLVRNQREFARIHSYIENNPVRARLVRQPSEYR